MVLDLNRTGTTFALLANLTTTDLIDHSLCQTIMPMNDKMVTSNSIDVEHRASLDICIPELKKKLHSLANKILPITVFTHLALQKCHDPSVSQHLQKIEGAASEAQELMSQIRQLLPQDNLSS